MKFSAKLTILFSGLGLVVSLVITYLVYSSNITTLEKHITDRLQNQAFHTMDKIDRMLFERAADIKVLASDPVISSKASTTRQITERLRKYQTEYKQYTSLSFFDLNRIRLADTGGQELGKKHSFSAYWTALSQGREVVTEISRSESLNQMLFHFASVVKDRNGVPVGVVVSRTSLDMVFNTTIQAVGIYDLAKDFSIDLVDKDGLVLYSNYNKEGILKEIQPDWDMVRKLQATGTKVGKAKYINPKENIGEEILVFVKEQGYLDFKGHDCTLIIYVPTDVAFASARELKNKITGLLFAVGIPAFFLIFFSSRKISAPIARMSAAAAEVGKGNLEVRVEALSKDETGQLAEAFNKMAADLKEYRDRLLAHSRELEIAVEKRTEELQRELSERRLTEKALHENKELLQAIIDNTTAVIYLKDSLGKYLLVNKRYEDLFHVTREEITGKTDYDIFPAKAAAAFQLNDKRVFTGNAPIEFEEQVPQGDGTHIYISIKFPLCGLSGAPYAVCGISTDITERKKAEEQMARLAHTDSLTGLPNRGTLYDRLNQVTAQAHRDKRNFAVLYADLDNFKIINDTLGHEMGDLVLKEAAQRLQSCVREMDTVARIGGDEFVFVLVNIHSAHDAATVAGKIISAISRPFVLNKEEYFIGCSIGISLYPTNGQNIEDLLNNADRSMYLAKGSSKNNYRFYSA